MCVHVYYGGLRQKDGLKRLNKKMQVFIPELWQFVCLIFGRENNHLRALTIAWYSPMA